VEAHRPTTQLQLQRAGGSMALFQLLQEEEIVEGDLHAYFEELYTIVCISERPASFERPTQLMRTTYVVDWEQLVHLLEDYSGFGEDIVHVARLTGDQARIWRHTIEGQRGLARA
jgi:hypothetical protein